MHSRFASPGSDYLEGLGELVYAVGSLEWLLLGDLDKHRSVLPPTLTVESLAGETTVTIANRIRDAVPAIADPVVGEFYERGAAALLEVGELRNAVLHSRPATMPDEAGSQRLYRWRLAKGAKPMEAFWIDDGHLDRTLRRITQLNEEVNDLRAA